MKIGDYVLTHCYDHDNFYAYILSFDLWVDEKGDYEMVELLCDNGYIAYLPPDAFEVISESW